MKYKWEGAQKLFLQGSQLLGRPEVPGLLTGVRDGVALDFIGDELFGVLSEESARVSDELRRGPRSTNTTWMCTGSNERQLAW